MKGFDVEGYKRFKEKYPRELYLDATQEWAGNVAFLDQVILRDDVMLFHQRRMKVALYLRTGNEYQQHEMPFLEARYSEQELRRHLWDANPVPQQILSDEKYQTTEARVHHLTHLTMFKEKTSIDPIGLGCVVEFGGGYGGMCKVTAAKTHVIVDFAAVLFLQSLYLANAISPEAVNLIDDEDKPLKRGVINLVPIQFANVLQKIRELEPDLLLSCWSLSEASWKTQQKISQLKFFGAKHILHGDLFTLPVEYFGADYELIYGGAAFYGGRCNYLFMRRK